MTVEECFEEWWTPKELPENGFNKTAMLDFAEMYHNQALRIHDVICRFNTSEKRMVRVISGDDNFIGEVTKIEWDLDQWAYFVNGEWYCQSEINRI